MGSRPQAWGPTNAVHRFTMLHTLLAHWSSHEPLCFTSHYASRATMLPRATAVIFPNTSDLVVVEHKVDVPRSLRVVLDKVLVTRRPLLLCVAGEHALQADTHALHIVNRAPALFVEEVETDDAVGVDVRVPWNGMLGVFDEDYLWRLTRNNQ
jgi:hypothetical protein